MSSFLRSLRRGTSRQHIVLRSGDLQVSLRRDGKVVAVVEEESRLPWWLLANAKAAAMHNCRLPEAAEWEGCGRARWLMESRPGWLVSTEAVRARRASA